MRFVPSSPTTHAFRRLTRGDASHPTKKKERDARVDFFRGLALWFIFLDHVPSNTIGQFTLRNFGFSDATEIFVFISGYSAAIAYGRSERKLGFVYMTAHVWRRCWQLYVAHLILFIFYTAQIAWIAERFSNSMYIEELNITRFLEAPHIALLEALTLRFRPANLDILPLYIVLLFFFPFVLRALRVMPLATLAASFALYLAARFIGWNLPTSVEGIGWFFNPFAWQLLFFVGALCAIAPDRWRPMMRWRRWAGVTAAIYLVLSAIIASSWQIAPFGELIADYMPSAWFAWMYPIDKTNLDVLRLVHFLAMAYLCAHFVPTSARFLQRWWARPLIACGKQSLYVFCLGIFLSFAAHFALVEFNARLPMQIGVSVAGVGLMTALAALMNWYRRREAAGGVRTSTRTVNG
ncbi:MAG: OpgC domain-containing protein [Burkholderiaceae bacterium]